MPGQRYNVGVVPISHSRRRRGWHESTIGLLDDRGHVVATIVTGGYGMLEVERITHYLAAALREMPDEPALGPRSGPGSDASTRRWRSSNA